MFFENHFSKIIFEMVILNTEIKDSVSPIIMVQSFFKIGQKLTEIIMNERCLKS